ncbi:hypothetical protein [Rhodospirillum sp. A1_3_36]|uniref:hypothetical protein n=1 Tax=Rhodospirillum sp. A1_3_36 TaxID=3391666 RepID=UPI0039A706EE
MTHKSRSEPWKFLQASVNSAIPSSGFPTLDDGAGRRHRSEGLAGIVAVGPLASLGTVLFSERGARRCATR